MGPWGKGVLGVEGCSGVVGVVGVVGSAGASGVEGVSVEPLLLPPVPLFVLPPGVLSFLSPPVPGVVSASEPESGAGVVSEAAGACWSASLVSVARAWSPASFLPLS